MSEARDPERREARTWPWPSWRLVGCVPVPPVRRTLRASDGIDEAAIGGGPGDLGAGADIATHFGPFEIRLIDDDEDQAAKS